MDHKIQRFDKMSSVEATVDIDAFSKWLDLKTKASNQSLQDHLHNWSSDPSRLQALRDKAQRFKQAYRDDPTFFNEVQQRFQEIAEIEQEVTKMLHQDSELERESYNELLFFKPLLQPLNFVPFLLTLWSTIRVYLLPGLSLLLPFLTLIAPYLILTFIFHIPITFHNYMNMLQSMVSGNFQKVMDPTAHATVSSGASPINLIKQFGVVLVTFIQGIIQPYWTFKHLSSIDSLIKERGTIVMKFKEAYQSLENSLSARGFTFFSCPLPEMNHTRDATARILLEAPYFKLALKYIGSLEVIMKLTHKEEVNPVSWVKSKTPVFRVKNTFDFQVSENKRKTISAVFDTKRHALLTGPNKGGKSTVLRALSTSALLAHTYGCSLGKLTSTPFETMHVCLKPDDLPGSKSRFEREIEFTASTLSTTAPILVFIDELYHSTNPPDALRSCEIYCGQLWKKNNVISVISTHLFELVEKADPTIQRFCCPAEIDSKGTIHFHYRLEKGICKVSSVDTLLRKNGLLRDGGAMEFDF
jgi:hypothetical protein